MSRIIAIRLQGSGGQKEGQSARQFGRSWKKSRSLLRMSFSCYPLKQLVEQRDLWLVWLTGPSSMRNRLPQVLSVTP